MFETVTITSVGGVRSYERCGNKVTFPTISRWRYRSVSVWAYVLSQGRVMSKPMKFGQCMQKLWVTVFCGEQYRVWGSATLEMVITTFNAPWLKSNLINFEGVIVKSVGGVRSYARCGNRQNGTNLHPLRKMTDFLWTWHHDVPGFFVRLGMTKACTEFHPPMQN